MAIQQFCKAYWQRQLESSGAKLPDGIDADSLLTEAECREREKAAYKTAWKDLLEDEFEDVLAEAAADAYLTSCYGERRRKNGVE